MKTPFKKKWNMTLKVNEGHVGFYYVLHIILLKFSWLKFLGQFLSLFKSVLLPLQVEFKSCKLFKLV